MLRQTKTNPSVQAWYLNFFIFFNRDCLADEHLSFKVLLAHGFHHGCPVSLRCDEPVGYPIASTPNSIQSRNSICTRKNMKQTLENTHVSCILKTENVIQVTLTQHIDIEKNVYAAPTVFHHIAASNSAFTASSIIASNRRTGTLLDRATRVSRRASTLAKIASLLAHETVSTNVQEICNKNTKLSVCGFICAAVARWQG